MNALMLLQALVAWLVVTASGVVLLELAAPLVRRYARSKALAGQLSHLIAVAWLPQLVGVVVVAGCYTPSLLARFDWIHDHCHAHGGHIHLCVNHVQAAGAGTLGWALVTFAAAWGGSGLVALARGVQRGFVFQRALALFATNTAGDHRVVDTPAALSLTTGVWSPQIFVTQGLLDKLTPQQQTVMLEHERCHVRERHALFKLIAAVGGVAYRPPTRRALVAEVALACERRSDEAAAHAIDDRLEVASTLLVGRRALRDTQLHAVLALAGSNLRERVLMLTDRDGAPASSWPALTAALAVIGVGLVLGYALHHTMETALSVLLV